MRLRIEHVPQPVAEHVKAEHRDKDGGSGDQREPRRDLDELKPHLHHVAPGWDGGLRPEADEAEAGLQDDREPDAERRLNDDRVERIRQDFRKSLRVDMRGVSSIALLVWAGSARAGP